MRLFVMFIRTWIGKVIVGVGRGHIFVRNFQILDIFKTVVPGLIKVSCHFGVLLLENYDLPVLS